MAVRRRQQQIWCGLLTLLLFIPAWGAILSDLRPGGSPCGSAGHACCCIPSGLKDCACDGHDGAATQLAALTTCSGAADLPTLLMTPPPAMLARAGVEAPPLRAITSSVLASPSLTAFRATPPVPPPPRSA
jgi:hypothetical protein